VIRAVPVDEERRSEMRNKPVGVMIESAMIFMAEALWWCQQS
jgi:hypothetical protein